MKENRNVMSWRITLAIMLIFGLGFTLGKVTSIDKLAKIEGYKIKIEQDALAMVDDATSGNVREEDYATDPNATSSNVDDDPEEDYATSPNATSSNADDDCDEDYATNPNATSSNAEPEEPVITDPVRVELDGKEKIELKNDEITENHIKYIRTSTKDVVVDATNNTKISKELLSAISAANKNTLVVNVKGNQFVFYGSKIETITDVDVYMTLDNVSSEENIAKLVQDKKGVVISFKEGNKFPEGTIVRVKSTDFVKGQLDSDAKVYSFNKDTGAHKLVQTNIGLEDGYYNLRIDGDAKYLLVNKDVELSNATGTTEEKKEVVEFIDSNMTYLLVVAGSGVVILVVVVMLITNRSRQEIKIEAPITPVTDTKPIEPQTTSENKVDLVRFTDEIIDKMVDAINETKKQ